MRRPTASASEQSPLPDFCSAPVLFALLVVAALTVTIMLLAPESSRGWRGYSVGMLFAEWMAMLMGVALCKLRPALARLPGRMPYAAIWLIMLAIVAVTSVLAAWMDRAVQMELVRGDAFEFVRDNTTIAALLGAAMLRYFYVLAQWQARLEAVTRAQVEALQARIRPHFLFNSMNTVAALIRMDPVAAERTVEDLSELFRAALGRQDTGDGTLEEELGLLERYLAIEQLRLGDRLRVHRELEGLPGAFPLPRLLLQPLVENAIRHGIQPLREGGDVILRGRRVGDAIEIEIDNPLPGTPSRSGNGHALDNVRQRVAYRYGPRAEVQAGAYEGRFVVRLHLPEEAHARTDR